MQRAGPRLRSTNTMSESVVYFEDFGPVDCTTRANRPTDTYNIANIFIGESKAISDVVTANFRKRIKAGEFILNPLHISGQRNYLTGTTDLLFTTIADTCTGPSLKSHDRLYGSFFLFLAKPYMTFTNSSIISSDRILRLQNEAWTKALAERRSGKTNLIESLAELDKSYAMLKHPLENVNKFLLNVRRTFKRRKGYERVSATSFDGIRFVSSEWLRFRYGIKPLVNDVKEVMKALETGWNREAEIHRSQGSATAASGTNTTGSINSIAVNFTYSIARGHYVSVRAKAFDSYRRNAFDHLGLTFHNVIAVPWELTRYSFVVDWFGNVGDLIYANIPRVNTVFMGGVVTTRQDWTASFQPTSSTNARPETWVMSGTLGDGIVITSHTLDRDVRNDTTGNLVIKDDFRLDNWIRASDAASLIIQRLKTIGF